MNFYFCCQGLGKKIEKYYLSDTVLVNDIDKKVISLEGQAKNNKKTVNTPPGVFGLLLIFLLLALRFFLGHLLQIMTNLSQGFTILIKEHTRERSRNHFILQE